VKKLTFNSKDLKQIKVKKPTPGFGGVAQVIVTTIGIFLASQIVAGVLIGIFLGVTHHGKNIAGLFDSAGAQFAYVLVAETVAIGLVYWALKFKKVQFRKIGFDRRPRWSDLGSGLLGFGAYYGVLIVVLAAASWLIPELNINQSQDVGFNSLSSPLDHLFAFMSLVILAPIGEEVLMRGYLYTGLRAKLQYLPSLLITSVIFGTAHLEFGNGTPLVWVAAISTFILSVVLVYKREKTGALYAGILIHILNNLVAFLVHF
jgi:membrane protease YdiL (CAAX protease family)